MPFTLGSIRGIKVDDIELFRERHRSCLENIKFDRAVACVNQLIEQTVKNKIIFIDHNHNVTKNVVEHYKSLGYRVKYKFSIFNWEHILILKW